MEFFIGGLIFIFVLLPFEKSCDEKFTAKEKTMHLQCDKVCAPSPVISLDSGECVCNATVVIKKVKAVGK